MTLGVMEWNIPANSSNSSYSVLVHHTRFCTIQRL